MPQKLAAFAEATERQFEAIDRQFETSDRRFEVSWYRLDPHTPEVE